MKKQRDYYVNINGKEVVDTIQFWKAIKPLFSDETKSSERLTLVEGDKILHKMLKMHRF